MSDMRTGVLDYEFDIHPFASDPKLVERWTDPFAEFVESMVVGL